ncbi:WW domain-binding protein 4 [Eumeta japonica]|uniref:WW domain-binding protein 4 n=1 Tax=Eumeta variegata TaxID=151549 RepID=A0A4C1XLV6_EUMVA|nr:WW domain-binding protein 4 [Eumeta japonica]
MTSQTTLIVASPSAAGRHYECRRHVTCAMDDAWWKSSRHRMSQVIKCRFLPPARRKRLAAAGTEYWKSQARKYCDFCKCWLADNKISVSFHENGKRHKENVKKHISQLSKRSAKEFKQKEKLDDEMKKMEKAAMAAYLKDIQNNADLTSQELNDILSNGEGSSKLVLVPAPEKVPVWHEVKSESGNYYWNTETNETTWDCPEVYLSLAEQEEQKLKKQENEKAKERLKQEQQKDVYKEVNARLAREKMKEKAVKQPELIKNKSTYTSTFGPAERATKPYGSWTPVVNKPQEKVDLQLPKSSKEPIPVPVVYEPETPRIEFNEKKVESLGEGPVEFKKRKFNNHIKRNMRQKTDDD